jgi:uncharacterized protein (TIGR03067 family)
MKTRFSIPETIAGRSSPRRVRLGRMIWFCLLLSFFVRAPGAFAETPGSDAAARKQLIGVWEGWVVEGDGSRQGDRRMRISELVITLDKISATGGQGNSMGEGAYKLSVSQGRKTIDATGTDGEPRGKLYLGIYSLEGDTLKWCSGSPGKSRPGELRTNPGLGHFLMILKRKK